MLPRWTTPTAAETGWVAASAEPWRALHPERVRGRRRDRARACLGKQQQRREACLCTVDLSRTGVRAVPVTGAEDQAASWREAALTAFALAHDWQGNNSGPRLARANSPFTMCHRVPRRAALLTKSRAT